MQGAHQIVNDGSETLIYVGLSSSAGPDFVEYPDSGKISSRTNGPPNGQRFIFKKDSQVDFFDGDKDAQ
jgi:uncharacterized cupin superfamily protein